MNFRLKNSKRTILNILINNPLVSVVMATFNGGRFLSSQLHSICNQSYSNIEIIISDDCSSDRTQEIIKEFAEKDKRIRYSLNESNIGLNKNFEKAILMAKGSFIAISDQDDIWKTSKIEEQLRLFKDEETVLTHSASLLFSELPPENYNKSINSIMMSGNNASRLLLRNSISGHNMLFRSTLIPFIIPIPSGVYYDWWIAEVSTCVGKIASSNRILTFHRKHDNNVTPKNKKNARQTKVEADERFRALQVFVQIPKLPRVSKMLASKLLIEYEKLQEKRFSFRLFVLLLTNASVLFFYKKKKLPYLSYIKTAFRMSHSI